MVTITPISQSQRKALSNISALCALLVVAIHVPVDVSRFGEHSVFGFWLLLFHEGFARAAVPIFFFISGYLLAGHFCDKGWYVVAIRKRIRTLLIPYIALNMLLLLCVILGKAIKSPANVSNIICDLRYIIGALGLSPWEQPINFVLWYLRCLLYFVLLSPVIKKLTESRKVGILAVGGLLCLAEVILCLLMQGNSTLSKVNWITNFDIYGLAVFALGCAVRQHSFACLQFISRVGFFKTIVVFLGVIAAYAIWICFDNPPKEALIFAKGVIILPVCSLIIYKLARAFDRLSIISRNTMPLFGLQVVVLFGASIVALMFGKSLLAQTLPMYLATWASVAVMCIVIGIVLRRLLPKFSSVIFGGR